MLRALPRLWRGCDTPLARHQPSGLPRPIPLGRGPRKVFFATYTPQKRISSYLRRCGGANSVRPFDDKRGADSVWNPLLFFRAFCMERARLCRRSPRSSGRRRRCRCARCCAGSSGSTSRDRRRCAPSAHLPRSTTRSPPAAGTDPAGSPPRAAAVGTDPRTACRRGSRPSAGRPPGAAPGRGCRAGTGHSSRADPQPPPPSGRRGRCSRRRASRASRRSRRRAYRSSARRSS